ncbi:helix-turn-helix domain-containing protein [Actinospica sp. MGRD01-02]|uniref:Helix-turn-helix domain-containing protein n=1 Tax=Actinospica acidithermotolerans TaxID=2828514 RepID=A0A941II09_9ACTN|nr:helix-turn-helix domain-containing protein [Actinospica acidithermotolerans]MBR7827819.1 helix-turn-helix domain-containing protein [Actinospica acidithermotolerans]
MNEHAKKSEPMPARDNGTDAAGTVPLLAPARRIPAVLAALEKEAQVAVIAAHADLPSPTALRHLQHLTRCGLAQAGKADPDRYAAAPGHAPLHPATLTPAGHAAAVSWHIACVYEAARVLGALALPAGTRITPDPARPPRTPANPGVALAWFTAEHDHLERELEHADQRGEHTHTWQLALLMLGIGCFTGPWPTWRQVYQRGITAARADRDRAAEATLAEAAGKLELTSGNPAAAREHQHHVLSLRAADRDSRGLVRSLNTIGVTFLREGALREAGELFTWALDLARTTGYQEFATFALMNLGAVHARTGPLPLAVKELHAAITALRASGRTAYLANALENLAAAYRHASDLERAEQTAIEAIKTATKAQVPMFLPGPLIEHAHILAAHGEAGGALALLHEARAIYDELGDDLRAERTRRHIEQLSQAQPPPEHAASEAAVDTAPADATDI